MSPLLPKFATIFELQKREAVLSQQSNFCHCKPISTVLQQQNQSCQGNAYAYSCKFVFANFFFFFWSDKILQLQLSKCGSDRQWYQRPRRLAVSSTSRQARLGLWRTLSEARWTSGGYRATQCMERWHVYWSAVTTTISFNYANITWNPCPHLDQFSG